MAELNAKELNEKAGSYMPAFFRMFINTDKPISNSGDKEVQSVFFHEYIHFLQDITTYAGLNNIFCISEYINEVALHYATKNPFYVPVEFENNDAFVRLNEKINRVTAGDTDNSDRLDIYDIFPSEQFGPDEESVGIDVIPTPQLLCTSERDRYFGRREIMESMAYILQRKCTQCPETKVLFPYCAAEKTAQFLYEGSFSENLENILALCDISLMSSNPGNAFIRFVKLIKVGELKVNRPEDIYDFYYSANAESVDGISPALSYFIALSYIVKTSLKNYIEYNEISEQLNKWVDLVFDTGVYLRLNDRYFFLELARGGYFLHNDKFMSLLQRIGSPIIENNLGDFCRFPSNPDCGEYVQFLAAYETIYRIYKEGCFKCTMQNLCKKTMKENPNIVVDEQCDNSPWTKIDMAKKNCPVAFLIYHRNLLPNPPVKWNKY